MSVEIGDHGRILIKMKYSGGILAVARHKITSTILLREMRLAKVHNIVNNASGQKPTDHEIANQADAWIVALRRENVQQVDLDKFAVWLSADSQHQKTWDKALTLWQTLGAISHMPLDALLAAESPDGVRETHQPGPAQASTLNCFLASFSIDRLRQRWIPVAMAFSLLLASALTALFNASPQSDFYSVGVGEYAEVVLADGSVVELNTDSAIEVTLTDHSREIELLRGEAFFAVAPDKSRPFIVDVAGATVRAVGTAFNIYKVTGESAVVAVTEGIVRIEEADGSSMSVAQSRLVTADQALKIDLLRGLSDADVDNVQATAWRHGHLLFNSTPLAEAVAMLNRYLVQKVVVADTVPSSVRLSGTFSSRQKKETLLAVAQALSLELTPHGDKWVLSQNTP